MGRAAAWIGQRQGQGSVVAPVRGRWQKKGAALGAASSLCFAVAMPCPAGPCCCPALSCFAVAALCVVVLCRCHAELRHAFALALCCLAWPHFAVAVRRDSVQRHALASRFRAQPCRCSALLGHPSPLLSITGHCQAVAVPCLAVLCRR